MLLFEYLISLGDLSILPLKHILCLSYPLLMHIIEEIALLIHYQG